MDWLRNLISVRRPSAGPAATTASETDDRVGAFVTAATLVTFPVASAVVLIIWKVLDGLPIDLFNGRVGIGLAAVLVGGVIYLLSYKSEGNIPNRVGEFGIAVINTFVLYAAASGIDVTVLGGTGGAS
jgi:hypothetical protein